jgi:hypothetical protein
MHGPAQRAAYLYVCGSLNLLACLTPASTCVLPDDAPVLGRHPSRAIVYQLHAVPMGQATAILSVASIHGHAPRPAFGSFLHACPCNEKSVHMQGSAHQCGSSASQVALHAC